MTMIRCGCGLLILLIHFCVVFSAICIEEDDTYLGNFLPARRNIIEDVLVRQYTGKTMCDYTERCLKEMKTLLNSPIFNINHTTIFYVHGYNENPLRPSARGITRAYLKRNDTNFLFLNWNNMAFTPYFFNAIPNSRKVAYETAKNLNRMFIRNKLKIEKFHLMGHSLGSQLANMIAEHLKAYGFFVPRLTHLDPVGFGPLRNEDLGLTLNNEAAQFVDVIHTYAGIVGTTLNVGHVDFWPNGGHIQPGCIESFRIRNAWMDFYCSHRRSWEFWVESMQNPTAFRASKSSSCFFQRKRTVCEKQIIPVYMGFNVDKRLRGVYHLVTNKSSPYGRGIDGSCVCNSWFIKILGTII